MVLLGYTDELEPGVIRAVHATGEIQHESGQQRNEAAAAQVKPEITLNNPGAIKVTSHEEGVRRAQQLGNEARERKSNRGILARARNLGLPPDPNST